MRILQINALADYRSTGRNTIELSEYLEKKGYESWIAYSRCLKPVKNSYRINSDFDVKIHGLMSRITGLQGYFSYFATKRLIKFMKEKSFDLVVLGNLHSNFVNIPMLFKYFTDYKIPVVIVLHDCFMYTGKCCHYTEDNCYKWQTECRNCKFFKKNNPSWFFDRTNKLYNMKKKYYSEMDPLAVIGVSKWITNEAKKSVLKNAKIINTVYNWVDLEVFCPKTNDLKNKYKLKDKFVILGVASGWGKGKGIDLFYKLAEVLPDNCHIVLVGKNDNKKENDNITYIDETHDVFELAEIYNMADVFLNLSLEESFGKVSAEALSCGTPLITTNTTANPELVGENCGYVLENRDIDTILKYVNIVKENKKEFYTDFARKFSEDNFDKNKNLQKYLYIFNDLLKG